MSLSNALKTHFTLFAVIACQLALAHAQSASPTPETSKSESSVAGQYIGIILLVLSGGMFSGMTLGIMGLDSNQLQIVAEAGTPSQRRAAQRILPVRKKGNLLLCTLILGNMAGNSLLSILMADLTNGLSGFFISTAVIVVASEIIPMASCSRHALTLGSRLMPLVVLIMVLLYPIAKPLAMVLDFFMGEEIGTYYTKNEFTKLLKLHLQSKKIAQNEADIMTGAITFSDKRVSEIMTPQARMFCMRASDRLDYDTMARVFRAGYSRVPVLADDGDNVVGILYAKDLIMISAESCMPVIAVVEFFKRTAVLCVFDDDSLGTLMKRFHDTSNGMHQHVAIVRTVDTSDETRDPVYRIVGLVTLEDVVEEILQREIVDEYDRDETGPNGTGLLEYGRLRLLDTVRGHNDMSVAEVRAVAAYLAQSVKPFKPSAGPRAVPALPFSALEHLVKTSQVVDVVGSDSISLYERGVISSQCILILSGTIEIKSGDDEIVSIKGPWDAVGENALIQPIGAYKPDFSAVKTSPKLRYLAITKALFEAAVVWDPSTAPVATATTVSPAVGPTTTTLLPSELGLLLRTPVGKAAAHQFQLPEAPLSVAASASPKEVTVAVASAPSDAETK